MGLTDVVNRTLLAGAMVTASVGACAVTISVPAVAEAKELEELTAANFSRKVYHNPKPVIVLFYQAEHSNRWENSLGFSQRMEQIVEELADKYAGQVAFFKVAIDHNLLNATEYQRVFDVPDTVPLTVIYGRFDVLTRQQSPHNFKIDMKKGGPKDDDSIKSTGYYTDLWIQQNLFGHDSKGDRKLYRYEGTFQIHEVGVLR